MSLQMSFQSTGQNCSKRILVIVHLQWQLGEGWTIGNNTTTGIGREYWAGRVEVLEDPGEPPEEIHLRREFQWRRKSVSLVTETTIKGLLHLEIRNDWYLRELIIHKNSNYWLLKCFGEETEENKLVVWEDKLETEKGIKRLHDNSKGIKVHGEIRLDGWPQKDKGEGVGRSREKVAVSFEVEC